MRNLKQNWPTWCNDTYRISVSCRLLITFEYSLDPDQARQNVGPDQDPNCLTL